MVRNAVRRTVFVCALILAVAAAGLAVTADSATAAPATCSGLIFQDYDADGERLEDYSFVSSEFSSVLDDGVAGIAVNITTVSGTVVSTTTSGDGSWSLGLDTEDFPIRIDVTGLPAGWTAAPKGVDSAGLTQFVNDASDCGDGNVGSAGVTAPGTFCENRPEILTTCFLFGDIPNHDSQAAIVSVPDAPVDDGSTSGDFQVDEYVVEATLGQVGTVFGVAHLENDTTLAASFVKRHTQLGPTGNPTTIYAVNADGSVGPWLTVDPGATDPHSGDSDGWQNDFASFDDVGRTGLGDIEVSPDGSTVYTVDLGRKLLVQIPVNADGSAGAPSTTPITAASTGAPCSDADIRPFALGFDGNTLLVGVTCSAESSVNTSALPLDLATISDIGDPAQLSAHVYSFNGGFSLLTNVPLPTTSRGVQNGVTDPSSANYDRGQAVWRPWVSQAPFAESATTWPAGGVAYAQPLLSDIEVDGDDLVIGFMDLWGHQMGSNAFYEGVDGDVYQIVQPLSSGDTVRAETNGSGGFTYPTSGPDFFYTGDDYGTTHDETTLGAAVQIPGRPYVVSNAFDPINGQNTWQSGGIEYFSNTTGEHLLGYRLYDGRTALATGTFEKAAGIGDVQADCGVAPIEVGDFVWFDVDQDGIADPGETPLDGIVIELVDANGNVIATATTDANGLYSFHSDEIDGFDRNGNYVIRVAQENFDAGGAFNGGAHDGLGSVTFPNAGSDDANDSDGELVNGLPSISFTATDTDHTMDFGFIEPTYQLGNTVWIDFDEDGTQNNGEPGIAGVEVQLLDATGNVLATTTTDGNGNYLFTGLDAGDYVVAIADTQQAAGAPLDGLDSTDGNGAAPDPDDDVDLDDNGDPAPGFASISLPVTIGDGEPLAEAGEDGVFSDVDSNLTVDFGFVPTYRLGDTVWFDVNNNGIQDAGEAGIAGVDVELLDDTGAVVATTTTDADGNYIFDNLDAGDYVVALPAANPALDGMTSSDGNGPAVDPDDDVDLDDNGDPAAGYASISAPVTIGGFEPVGEVTEDGSWVDALSNVTVDFGFYGDLRLGSTVWLDENGDGVQGADEAGIAGVEVQLMDDAGNVVATTTTDADGNYVFENLAPGDYVVMISDSQLGGPLSGLRSTDGNGTAPDPDDDVDLDDNGDPAPGYASISAPVTLSAGDEPTGEAVEGDWEDADSNLTVDFGFVDVDFVGPLRLGSTVWLDNDGNGSQDAGEPGIAGVEVQLWSADADGNPVALLTTTTTDASGNYVFDNLAAGDYVVAIPEAQTPLDGLGSTSGNGTAPDPDNDADLDDNGDPAAGFASISAAVTLTEGEEPAGEAVEAGDWDDVDSNFTVDFGFVPVVELGNTVFLDDNNNGVQDAGEGVVPGVTLELVDADGNVVASDVTDANGNYSFLVEPGTYTVQIPASQFEEGAPLEGKHASTGEGVSTDPNDDVDGNSDGVESNGAIVSGPVTLTAGGEPTGEADASPNGIADADSNLTVDFGVYMLTLGDLVFFDNNNNGVQDAGELPIAGVELALLDSDGNVLATTTTDVNGNYLFMGLAEGEYVVKVLPENFEPGGALDGTSTSNGNDVDGAAPDPDNDTDGDDNGTFMDGMVVSAPILLNAAEEPDGNGNATVDFGFIEGAGLGDFVFFDQDNDGQQDAGEPGVPGITVNLIDPATGETIATTVTDGDGYYSFRGLVPGDYTVTFVDPEGRGFTSQNVGNDASDSDASSDGSTPIVTLQPGEFNPTIDAGIVVPVTQSSPPLAFTGANSKTLALFAAMFAAFGFVLVAVTREEEEEDLLV